MLRQAQHEREAVGGRPHATICGSRTCALSPPVLSLPKGRWVHKRQTLSIVGKPQLGANLNWGQTLSIGADAHNKWEADRFPDVERAFNLACPEFGEELRCVPWFIKPLVCPSQSVWCRPLNQTSRYWAKFRILWERPFRSPDDVTRKLLSRGFSLLGDDQDEGKSPALPLSIDSRKCRQGQRDGVLRILRRQP